MTRTIRLTAVAAVLASAAAVAGAAHAQPAAGARATLYEFPNFQGRSITITGADDNLQNDNFNDTARSAHFDGDWTVCSDAGLRGNCQTLSGDVPNLDRFGLGRSVSSLRQGSAYGQAGGGGYGRDPGPDRGYGYGDRDRGDDDRGGYAGGYGRGPDRGPDRGYGDDRGYDDSRWSGSGGIPGRSVVFFPRPKQDGQDIAAFDRSAADWFCRRQGLGAAAYYDTSYRGRGFRFNGGGFTLNAPVLRDVVCRK
ncbi:beta/gamma crystallin-related protein [Caulobacter sp. KR2-114]|uniref:beta/gamma crystallin-related protein n=1 Tax=Caulobacter sp. KR2-114 TaxID=3400912 RepID=UPI003C11AC07